MADQSRTFDLDAQEQRVPIAVGVCGNDSQTVTGALALRPKLVAGPAEEGDIAPFEGAFYRLAVHEAHHQHFAVERVLHYRGDETVHLFEVE